MEGGKSLLASGASAGEEAFEGGKKGASNLDSMLTRGDPITPELQKEIEKLSLLNDEIKNLRSAGWTFKRGAPGGGTFCVKGDKSITVDPLQARTPEVLLQSLAHEVSDASRPAAEDDPNET